MARLPQGTRKRKDGTLEKRFTMNGVRYSVYGATTKEILEKETELREQIKQGVYNKNRDVTLDQYFAEWIQNKEQHTKSNSVYTYRCIYKKHIKPHFGNEKIQSIERRQVVNFRNQLETKSTTTNYIMLVFRIILNDAIRDEIINRNPCNDIKSVKSDQEKATDTKHRALTPEEQATFMQALQGHYYYNFIALMLSSGMRCGEVSALLWSDIDYKNNVIHISRTATKNKNGLLIIGETPKTESGKRDIPLTDTIKKILEEQKQQDNLLPFPNTYVFKNTYGDIISGTSINNAIKYIIKKLSCNGIIIDPFTSHAFRDTFATRFIEQGGNMNTLKSILGHKSITMTMDLYAHVLPDSKAEEMNKINIAI